MSNKNFGNEKIELSEDTPKDFDPESLFVERKTNRTFGVQPILLPPTLKETFNDIYEEPHNQKESIEKLGHPVITITFVGDVEVFVAVLKGFSITREGQFLQLKIKNCASYFFPLMKLIKDKDLLLDKLEISSSDEKQSILEYPEHSYKLDKISCKDFATGYAECKLVFVKQ